MIHIILHICFGAGLFLTAFCFIMDIIQKMIINREETRLFDGLRCCFFVVISYSYSIFIIYRIILVALKGE